MSGITPLLYTLKCLEGRGIKGRILTTNYLNFTEPKALDKLASFSNIEVRIYDAEESKAGFHSKGYIFKERDEYRIIIGSANITGSALTINKEWNTKFISLSEGGMARDVLLEFDTMWNSQCSKKYEDFISLYTIKYDTIKQQKSIVKNEFISSFEAYQIKPNSMQTEVISNMNRIVDSGEGRALLISATGTGKTFAAAFVVRDVLKPQRFLFLVHREQIAKQAIKSFERIMGRDKSFGLLSGNSKDIDVDYLFSQCK